MNEHQVKGRVKEGIGNAKEVIGDAIDDEELQLKGVAQKTAGKIQAGYGDAKEDADDAEEERHHHHHERKDD